MLTVVCVNYNSALLSAACYRSIADDVDSSRFEFIAVDSGSRQNDLAHLRSLIGHRCRIIAAGQNVGYAAAANLGIRHARGDIFLVTNPDVLYLPGSIQAMLDAVRTLPRCGAVGPRTWWDRDRTFLLPESELVTPMSFLADALVGFSGLYARLRLMRWLKRNMMHWNAEFPCRKRMLSGACIMTTRQVWEKVGCLDESFALYYEDTDWCLRVEKAGYRLYAVPKAQIVHYYNQSARQETHEAERKFHTSMIIYMNKHFPRSFHLVTKVTRLLRVEKPKWHVRMVDLDRLLDPPVISFRDSRDRLLILTPVPTMIPAAGAFSTGEVFRIPGSLWDSLGHGRYYFMSFVKGSLWPEGAWTWVRESQNNQGKGEGMA